MYSIQVFDEVAIAKAGVSRSKIIDLARYLDRPLGLYTLVVSKFEGSGAVNFTYEAGDGATLIAPTGATTFKNGHDNSSGGHGVVPGDTLTFSGVAGMTEINSATGTVASVDAATITTNINSTAYTAYTSGGVLTPNGDSTRSCVISGITAANPAVVTVAKGRDLYTGTIKAGRFFRIVATENDTNTVTALSAWLVLQ